MDPALDPSADATADAIVTFLRDRGADATSHAGGRTLLDHLIGTAAILRRWGQPAILQHAALVHSVYGTEAFHERLVAPTRRHEVAGVAGGQAERLAHLFSVTPRGPLFAGTHLWARDLPTRASAADDAALGESLLGGPPSRDELDALVLLHMANLADQAQSPDGSPGRWLTRVRDLARHLDPERIAVPAFVPALAAFTEADEARIRAAYLAALRAPVEQRSGRMAIVAAACPVLAEPCAWLARLARDAGDDAVATAWTALARQRLTALGTAWDKRSSYDEWLALIERPRGEDAAGGRAEPPAAWDRDRERFLRYVESLADDPAGGIYPELPAQPWLNPSAFPLVTYLESRHAAIRAEILALDAARFHRESERIGRTGDWDVVFLYERGRRRDDVCAACPVTARGIDALGAVRTMAGLVYVSRMRAGTHISAHHGPTNLRVRCHLGISVPDGDCAIRVGGETRHWEAGRCLVFDDHFEHEAWNHTGEDRIVLIVDLWHPALSAPEVALLEALHGYADLHARRLSRYWAANAAAAAGHTGPHRPPGETQNSPSPSPPKSPPPSPSPSPNSPPSPSPSPSPNSPPTMSPPIPSPAPSADPISSVDIRPPPPNPLK